MKAFYTLTMVALIFFPLNTFADECTAGDCQNGKGTLVFSSGHSYTGMFKGGVRHGEGVLLMPGGRKIVGIWENNEIIKGTYTEPDGTVYEGHWRHRERNGQGTNYFPDGTVQEGIWKNDEFQFARKALAEEKRIAREERQEADSSGSGFFISKSTVQTQVERGMKRLRKTIGVDDAD